jgi:hypothetical protein
MAEDTEGTTRRNKGAGMRGEWDVITATNEGDLVWQRYGDGVIIVARPGEHPDDALARHIEREKRD